MSFPRIIRKFCLNDFRKRSVQLKRYISRHSLRHTFSAVQAKKVPCKFRWKCAVSDSFRSSKFFQGRTHQVIFFFLRYLLRLLFAICGVVPDVGFIGQKRLREDRQSELSTASLIVFARIRTFPFSSVSASCFYFHLISSARLIPTLSPDKLS